MVSVMPSDTMQYCAIGILICGGDMNCVFIASVIWGSHALSCHCSLFGFWGNHDFLVILRASSGVTIGSITSKAPSIILSW